MVEVYSSKLEALKESDDKETDVSKRYEDVGRLL